MTVSIHLEGEGRNVDPDVLTELVALRLFMETKFGPVRPGDTTASAGFCFDAAGLMGKALTDLGKGEWAAWEGWYWSDEAIRIAKEMVSARPSDIDDIAQSHGFAVSPCGTIVADITADQFGLAHVVVTDDPMQRWQLRYPNEMYSDPRKAAALASEWRAQRDAWVGRARGMAETAPLNRIPGLNP
jgi:hypothetical protein